MPSVLSPVSTLPTTYRGHVKRTMPLQHPVILFGKGEPTDIDDTVEFEKQNQAIEEEIERLRMDHPTGLLGRLLMPDENVLKARAEYNITGKPAALNPYLPYRELLAKKNATKPLQQYDQLVQNIMTKVEFRQAASTTTFSNLCREAFPLKDKPSWLSWILKPVIMLLQPIINRINHYITLLRSIVSPHSFKKAHHEGSLKAVARGASISDQNLAKVIKGHAKSGVDPSTRYMVAAGIADLLYQHPEYADKVLNRQQGHPLRIVMTKDISLLTPPGLYYFGLNLIQLNQALLWHEAQNKRHFSQHEFIHALSESTGMETLPMMNQDQKRKFLSAKEALMKEYKQKDQGWLGGLKTRFMTTIASSTGLPHYAFLYNSEFITVSLDMFKQAPKNLCKTKAGKEIYQIYKDLFSIDPLTEIKVPSYIKHSFP